MKSYATRIVVLVCAIALPIAAGRALPATAKAPARVATITLTATGLIVPASSGQAPQNLRFGTLRAKAIQQVSGSLGVPTKTGVYPECGQGYAIGYAKFRGGIELSFVGGKFVGWTLDYGGDKRFRTANGIGIGATVATLQKAFPDVFIDPGNEEDGGIGPGFTSDKWVNGWLDGDKQTSKVTSMYAGETCIVE